MSPRRRLAVIWTNFGPYHMARIRALTPHFEISAIELTSFERLYRWPEKNADGLVHTLRQGAWEDQNGLAVSMSLWRKLNALKPRVVLVPGYATLPALCAAAWGRVHGAQTVLMSESNFGDHLHGRLSEAAKRALVALLFDSAVVGGRRAASYLRLLGMPADRIGYRYDVVDNEYFSGRAAQCRSSSGEHQGAAPSPFFLYVGRLAPEKNLAVLLGAFAHYRTGGGKWQMVIVGDGPLAAPLRAQAENLGAAGAVIFAGHKSIDDLPRFYAGAGCFVLPSIREPWGLVVNEAMASRLPVIVSSRCGCADDLLERGSNGFIVDPTDEAELAGAMTRMSNLDCTERDQMGARSEEIIAGYSLQRWADEVRRIATVTHGTLDHDS